MWRWLLKIMTPKFISPKMERLHALKGAKSPDFMQNYYDSFVTKKLKDEEDAGQR